MVVVAERSMAPTMVPMIGVMSSKRCPTVTVAVQSDGSEQSDPPS